MFPYRYIHKYTSTSPDGKTHNKIHHVLTDKRRHWLWYWHLSGTWES